MDGYRQWELKTLRRQALLLTELIGEEGRHSKRETAKICQ